MQYKSARSSGGFTVAIPYYNDCHNCYTVKTAFAGSHQATKHLDALARIQHPGCMVLNYHMLNFDIVYI